MKTTYDPNWNTHSYPDAVLPDGGWPRTGAITIEDLRQAIETISGKPVATEDVRETVLELVLPSELCITANQRRIKEGFEPIIEKPVPPLGRVIRERDHGTKCPKCGSSLKRKWLFIKTDRCIQPECENYFYGLPMFDTSVPMPTVEAPKLTLKDAYVSPTGIKITNWREAR